MHKTTTLLLTLAVLLGILAVHPSSASAACTPLPTTRGTVTSTVTAPASGTYRVWSRIKTADVTKNSFYLQVDDTTCNVAVAANGITANTWTWVDYQAATTTNKLDVALTAGAHTLIMAGKDDNVELDRIILTQDTTCIPTGTGDNCAYPPDTTPPTVAITAPTTNTSLTGTTTVAVTATDDVAVAKVEVYVDGVLKVTDTASPYTYVLDPAAYTIGIHTMTAKAYDVAGNSASSSTVSFNVPDTAKPTVSISSPVAGATVSGTIVVAAQATDNVAVTKVEFYVDAVLKATDTTSTYSTSIDTTAVADGAHSLTAKAYDAAGNNLTSVAVSVTVDNVPNVTPDTTPPVVLLTAPTNASTVSGTINLVATASDASGIKQVQFYVDDQLKTTDTVAPYSASLDTTLLSNANHTFKAVATDNSPNANSATSSIISSTVTNIIYLAEDINKSGKVDLPDFSLLATDFNRSGLAIITPRADIDGDGTVSLADFSRLAAKFGQ